MYHIGQGCTTAETIRDVKTDVSFYVFCYNLTMEQITQERALELASNLLKVNKDELESKPLDNELGFYVYQPVRGGDALIVANDSSVLFANSSVNRDDHLTAFTEGKRTDPSAFNS